MVNEVWLSKPGAGLKLGWSIFLAECVHPLKPAMRLTGWPVLHQQGNSI
jgi:hypothetical protein